MNIVFGGAPYWATNRARGAEPHANPASLWGHEPCEGCAEMRVELHADPATGAFGGAPYGATNRVRGVPKWEGRRRRGRRRKERRGRRGTVSSKRGPNTTEWLGKKHDVFTEGVVIARFFSTALLRLSADLFTVHLLVRRARRQVRA